MSSTSRKESGQAILELALVIPLLVLLFTGIVDLGRAITQYSTHVQIVRDSINLGGRIANLESGNCYTTYAAGGVPTDHCSSAHMGNHLIMHIRARSLLLLRDQNIDWNSVRMESTYDQSNQSVRFRIVSNFTPLFSSFFGPIAMGTTLAGPFMMASGIQAGISGPPDNGCIGSVGWNGGGSLAFNSGSFILQGGGNTNDPLFPTGGGGTSMAVGAGETSGGGSVSMMKVSATAGGGGAVGVGGGAGGAVSQSPVEVAGCAMAPVTAD